MVAEVFTLTMNDIGLPFYQFTDIPMVIVNRHTNIGINYIQWERFYIVDIFVSVAFECFGYGQNTNFMTFLLQLFCQIAY